MEKRTANNWYPILVWLTFLLTMPISAFIVDLVNSKESFTFHDLFSLPDIINYIEFIFLLGSPIFIVYFLSFRLLIRLHKSSLLIKIVLNLICVAGIFISCLAFFKYIYISECLIFAAIFVVISLPFKIYRLH
jgi:hypothetical protein